MFNRETQAGLAPKSWTAVAIWLVIAAIVISRPGASIGFLFAAITGTGQWVSYHAFADCGEPPPMDWMHPKPCPQDPNIEPEAVTPNDHPPNNNNPDPDDLFDDETTHTPNNGDGYVVTVDETAIHTVLDGGADLVVGLHDEVTEMQDAGGITIHLGDQPTQGAD